MAGHATNSNSLANANAKSLKRLTADTPKSIGREGLEWETVGSYLQQVCRLFTRANHSLWLTGE
jgi:hypothetical protein